MALKLENVCYRYKNSNRDVLRQISCHFEAGRLSAVVGPSGSGKTTLLSIMAGLDEPSSGGVFIHSQPLRDMDLDGYRRQDVAMIFQAFHLFPLLTAVENAAYPLEMTGTPKAEARAMAAQRLVSVGIEPALHRRYPANLSGGEQQRVAIARALVTGAKVLLADEPTGNLDGENGARIMNILADLSHNLGYCVVIVTHDMAIAERSDVVFRMRDGVLG